MYVSCSDKIATTAYLQALQDITSVKIAQRNRKVKAMKEQTSENIADS